MFFGGAGDLIDGLNGNLIIILKTMFHRKRKHVGQRSKYAKIPAKTKLMFLRKVIQEGFSIRDVPIIQTRRPLSSTSTTPQPRPSFDSTRPATPSLT